MNNLDMIFKMSLNDFENGNIVVERITGTLYKSIVRVIEPPDLIH